MSLFKNPWISLSLSSDFQTNKNLNNKNCETLTLSGRDPHYKIYVALQKTQLFLVLQTWSFWFITWKNEREISSWRWKWQSTENLAARPRSQTVLIWTKMHDPQTWMSHLGAIAQGPFCRKTELELIPGMNWTQMQGADSKASWSPVLPILWEVQAAPAFPQPEVHRSSSRTQEFLLCPFLACDLVSFTNVLSCSVFSSATWGLTYEVTDKCWEVE